LKKNLTKKNCQKETGQDLIQKFSRLVFRKARLTALFENKFKLID